MMLHVRVVHLLDYMHVPAVLRDQGCIQTSGKTQGCARSVVRRMKEHNAARVALPQVRPLAYNNSRLETVGKCSIAQCLS